MSRSFSRKWSQAGLQAKPKVMIDARMVGPSLHGFARYVSLLVEGLRQVQAASESGGELGYEPVLLVRPDSPLRGFQTVVSDTPFLSFRELIEIPRLLKREGISLYHSPTFSSLVTSPCPWIVTVHDLNHLHFGSFQKKLYYRGVLRPFMRKASALATVSEYSRGEISRWLGLNRDRIELVPNALDPSLGRALPDAEIESVLKARGLRHREYFFCLSNPKPHKNVETLVQAFERFRSQERIAPEDWPLVMNMTEWAGRPGIIASGSLPESELRALLQGAAAFFFPSIYEGFGLPPVESATLGVRVVASDIPPHREGLSVLKSDEALFVHPSDVKGWSEAFEKARKGELRAPGDESRRALLERYSVTNLGRNMDRIYRRVLRIRNR